jgi:hypothetical protein
VLLGAGVCVDVNRFSLHGMYRDRLIRTFLGATRGRYPRPPYPPDDTDRYANRTSSSRAIRTASSSSTATTTRSCAGSRRIAAGGAGAAQGTVPDRQRGAQPRCRTQPRVAGAQGRVVHVHIARGRQPDARLPAQHRLRGDAGGITLGTAMAVSGAAVSPNAGAQSSPVRTFLLGLCNARLGWWLGHPAFLDRVRRTSPGFAAYPLVSELLGRTDDTHPWLFVSDGGHFENLGLYEAVRRGCRDIVVVDASCDPDRNYDDLGNAIRKIRIDLGVRIERAGPLRIGPRELQRDGRYCALFDVIYDDTRSGSLLYIKTAVYPKAENMPIDVLSTRDAPRRSRTSPRAGSSSPNRSSRATARSASSSSTRSSKASRWPTGPISRGPSPWPNSSRSPRSA